MYLKNICLFLIIISNIFLFRCCETKKQQLEKKELIELVPSAEITNETARALEIDYVENDYAENENIKKIRIKNISDFNLSNISIKYNEVDSNKNIVSSSENFLQMSLMPSEVIYVELLCKNHIDDVEVITYNYTFNENKVSVGIKNNKFTITKIKKETNDIKDYDVLTTSDIYKVQDNKEDNVYEIKVKNLSKSDLGNIKIKVAELNEEKECIKVNDIIAYEVLKSLEEKKLQIILSEDAKYTELIGYSYDNISAKANIYIDKKIGKVNINK